LIAFIKSHLRVHLWHPFLTPSFAMRLLRLVGMTGGRGRQPPLDPMAMAEAQALEGGEGGASLGGGMKRKAATEGELEALERQKALIAAAAAHGAQGAHAAKAAAAANPEEIDLDDDDDEEGGGAEGKQEEEEDAVAVAGLVQKAVPASVFGETLAAQMAEKEAAKQ